jgi:hypothetical protein
MTSTSPIACSLSARDYAARLDAMRALADRALTARVPVRGGERLTFAARPGVAEELHRIVAAEAACCPFLELAVEPRGGVLALTVTGPAEVSPLIAELFA